MFRASESEEKIREINLLIDMQVNLFACRTSDHYFLLSLQWLSWDSSGTKNVSSTLAQNFWKVNKSWWHKRCGRYHILYILLKYYKLACWVECRKNPWNTMTACMICLYRRGSQETLNVQYAVPSLQNYFQRNCRTVIPMLLKNF